MKKIVLSIAAVMAAAAFAPEASAVPAFARQTGMACSACHFQHFPLLNGFGRAFKSGGFTMMGAQGKIEGEHLDIPNVVNIGGFTTTAYQNQSAGTAGALNGGAPRWIVPTTGGELSLFIGGRISEFAGFLGEAALGGNGAANLGGVVGAAKLALLFPVGDARVGAVIHSSTGQGVAYSFELLNTGAANTHKLMGNSGPNGQHVKATSASQYLGTNTAATGISLVANNSMGFINVGKFETAGNNAVAGANQLPLTYMRAAGIVDVAGLEAGFGIQSFSGQSDVTGSNLKATVLDAQLQGELADLPVGFYASYASAPNAAVNALAPAAAAGVTFNANPNTKTSFNVAAEVGIIPHVATIQIAYRNANNGAAANSGDNAIMLAGTYELAQNVALSLTTTSQSGSAWNVAGAVPVGKNATTLLLEALF
ncbi:MAG: hypothetical protein WCK93_03890 [Nitrosomonadales bacterium]